MSQLLLVGDSDIAFWPKDLLPTSWSNILVSGCPGATLAGVVKKQLPKILRRALEGSTTLFVVACAGENDIGEGLSLEKSLEDLAEFVDTVVRNASCKVVLIVLGPKFEPWLEDDPSYKKKYEAMSRNFERRLGEYKETIVANHSIHFVDCLTMFCGDTANLPGARTSGRAIADPRYFAADGLHLSREGYAVWKERVDEIIQRET